MSYARRLPREPEAQLHPSWDASGSGRLRLDPPTLAEPNISLSERQLELLAQRYPQPSLNRSNTQQRQRRDPSVVEHKQSAWMRTPNPISRSSEMSGSRKPSSPTYLNQILKKAMSSSSSHSGWAGSSNSSSVGSPLENHGKRSLKAVLAKRVLRNKKTMAPPPPVKTTQIASPDKNFSPGASAPVYTLRERLRRARQEGGTGMGTSTRNIQGTVKGSTPRKQETQPKPPPPPPPPPPPAEKESIPMKRIPVAELKEIQTKQDVTERERYLGAKAKALSPRNGSNDLSVGLVVRHPGLRKGASESKDSQEDLPEGYAELYQILEAEVFGQHSMLWASFQAVIKGESIPLPRVIRQPKPFKFSGKTKRALMTIHDHLKNNTPAELSPNTQLVNDKRLAKELASQLPALAASSSTLDENPSVQSDPILRARSSLSNLSGNESLSRSDFGINVNGAYLDDTAYNTTNSGPANTRQADDAILNIRSALSAEPVNTRQADDAILHIRSELSAEPVNSTRQADDAILNIRTALSAEAGSAASSKLKQHRMMPALTDSFSGSYDSEGGKLDSPYAASSGTGTADFDEDTGLEVTLGQFKLRADGPSLTSIPSKEPANSVPWAGIKLKPSKDATEFSSPADSLGSLLPEWANMRLRHAKRDDMENSVSEMSDIRHQRGDDSGSEMSSELGKLRDLSSFPIPESSTLVLVPPEQDAIVTESSSKDKEEAVDPTFVKLRQQESPAKAIAPKSSKRGRKIDDEAVVIRLIDVPDTSKEELARVIVGKQMLMLVKSKVGDPRAQVLWKLPRTKIDSLALDMATLKVQLILLDKVNVKVLAFSTSEDCLRFANTFYEHAGQVPDEETPAELMEVEVVDESGAEVDDSFHMEPLNEEEQNVLETYRRLRRTKGPVDALHASLPLQPLHEQPASRLSPEEDEIASVYRTMLTKGASFEGVEHQMRKDNIHEKLIALLSAEVKESSSSMPPRFVAAHSDPSSPVSAMSTTIGLSVTEAELAAEYKNMLQLKVAPGAVKHKMEKDHVDPKIMAAVLGGGDDASTISKQEQGMQLSEEEEKVAASFRRMIKLNFPEEVIRHRMRKEQINEQIVAAVFGASNDSGTSGTDPATEAPVALNAAEELVAKKYLPMLKLGIPKDAVRHRMIKDQVDQKIMNRVVGLDDEEPEVETAKKESPSASMASVRKGIGAYLSFEEESVATNYRKMLKLQIPRERVLIRMQQDGVSEKVISAVVGSHSHSDASDSKDDSNSVSGGSKLVSLHWTPLSGKELDNSVWRVTSKLEDSEAQPETGDISKLIALFQKKTAQKMPKEKAEDNSAGIGKARLLDLTRSNNVAISLKAFKDFSFKELADTIAFLDSTHRITGERTLFIRGLLPTMGEIKTIKAYQGTDDRLVPAELWFRQLAGVQRIEEKVHVMQTMELFQSEAETLRSSFQLLASVCNQVVDSEKLQTLLGMVLRIGNIMNEGTRTGGAAGFKFDSLLRLTQTKSSDGKTTVLDFLVTVFVEKDQRSTLDLLSDFPECHKAGRMVIGDLLAGAKELKESLEKCRIELNKLGEDAAGKTKSVKKLGSDTGSTSSGASRDAAAALMAAVIARGQKETEGDDRPKQKSAAFAKRDQFLAAAKEIGSDNGPPRKDELEEPAFSTEGQEVPGDDTPTLSLVPGIKAGISRLELFIRDADKTFGALDETRKEALEACNELSRYCGESSGTGATSTLLSILAEFASNLDLALKNYDATQESASRKLRKKGDDSSTLCSDETIKSIRSGSKSSESTALSKDSLVLMVNSMLKDANPRTKEDFKKGRVYPNPSSKLKAIYELESGGPDFGSPNTGRRKMDIVSAIREQGESIDQSEVQKARSQFGDIGAHQTGSSTPHTNTPEENIPAVSHLCGVESALALFVDTVRHPVKPALEGESHADTGGNLECAPKEITKTPTRIECIQTETGSPYASKAPESPSMSSGGSRTPRTKRLREFVAASRRARAPKSPSVARQHGAPSPSRAVTSVSLASEGSRGTIRTQCQPEQERSAESASISSEGSRSTSRPRSQLGQEGAPSSSMGTVGPISSATGASTEAGAVTLSDVQKKRSMFEKMFQSPALKSGVPTDSSPLRRQWGETGSPARLRPSTLPLSVASPPKLRRWQKQRTSDQEMIPTISGSCEQLAPMDLKQSTSSFTAGSAVSEEQEKLECQFKRSQGHAQSSLVPILDSGMGQKPLANNSPPLPSPQTTATEAQEEIHDQGGQVLLAPQQDSASEHEERHHNPGVTLTAPQKEGQTGETTPILQEHDQHGDTVPAVQEHIHQQTSDHTDLQVSTPHATEPRQDLDQSSQKKSDEKTHSFPTLSEARKSRSMFEKMVNSSTAPVLKKRESSPLRKNGESKESAREPVIEVDNGGLDTSASEQRLRNKPEDCIASANKSPLGDLSTRESASANGSVAQVYGGPTELTKTEHHNQSPSNLARATPPRTLSELARLKRLDRSSSPALKDTDVFQLRDALIDVPIANQQTEPSRESPVLRLARQKRETKNDDIPSTKQQQQPPPPPPPPPEARRESPVTQLARKRRQQKKSTANANG